MITNAPTLEELLACPTLPSLPAVALQVIELTSDDNVSMDELASTIQADQALAAKVLRTVNSSFYGLRERCASIRKALVLLGLSPVKSLTLGFSLVNAVNTDDERGFDYVDYWRRGLFTAVGARVLSDAAGLDTADEAFLAGLLQDIGMIAMLEALGPEYAEIVATTEGDHSKLARAELTAFDMQHPEIGAMLAQRWRLPDQLSIPIRYHEKPSAAPNEGAKLVYAVALGNIACSVLSDEDPTPATRRLYQRAEQWFRLTTDQCNDALQRINEGAAE
ncbi:MAG: HDOD domain-containing protein, partial [Planctomycetota bacterium]